jgi:hypothetical protein
MGMTFSHLLPGIAGFAAAVVTLWYSAGLGVIRNTIVLLLGFILLGIAIAIFLRSIKDKRKPVPKQDQAPESQMFQTLEQAIEEGRGSLELDVVASPISHDEISSPLAEFALQFDKALPEPKAEHNQSPLPAPGANGINHDGYAHPPANPAREQTAPVSLPRLSELRGMRFSQALRELDKAKRTAPPNAGPSSITGSVNNPLNGSPADTNNDTDTDAPNGAFNDPINETLMSAIAPFELMFASTASAPQSQNRASAMNKNGTQEPTSSQTFFHPKPPLPAKSRSHGEEDGGRSPREPKGPEQETSGFLEQLNTLPSRRGQYKKRS